MKQRILAIGLAVVASGVVLGSSSVEAASKKHLIVVHAKDNTGGGTVTVDKAKLHPVPLNPQAGPECTNAVCGASYAAGTRVTLTATAAEGSTFTGWSGECEGTSPTCVVRLSRSRDVMVHFSK
jgi:hypothetical protein